ncbi:MAG TPA: hypothetical protein VL307_19515 [Chitinophagaceae bacterium]|nr:hypothetical protein [Chitinophagaceae bacterium]
MKKWILIVLLPFLFLACKGKKKLPSDEEGITVSDFIEFFDDAKPPFPVADSSFSKQAGDTAAISYKTFTSLVPDTLLHKVFASTARPKIYPLAKMAEKGKETYLLLKAISPAQKAAFILVFNKDKQFVTGMPLLVMDKDGTTQQSATMDTRYTITTNRQRKAADGQLMYRKAVYAYSSSINMFALILIESNEAENKTELVNPIDSFPAKNKLAGDYRQNRLNIVSIRDGRKANELLFFVHFENSKNCKGELKGVARVTAPGKAIYQQPGDQCELNFTFTGNTVSLKEEGCGSHRDIQCFFEGRFTRKPPAKTPAKTGKQTKPVKKM